MEILIAILFGFFGGAVRASIGLLKKRKKLKKEFNLGRLLFTLIASAIIGGLVAAAISTSYLFYLAAGYAGTDFLEGLRKLAK